MKIRLLNNGGFNGLSKIGFPLEVPASSVELVGGQALVSADFMTLAGGCIDARDIGRDTFYRFMDGEFEVAE